MDYTGNATIKQHQKGILLDTKGQYMKESNTLADNATNNLIGRVVQLNTKGHYIRDLKAPI